MLTNCLAACTHLSSTVSQLFEPQVQKIAVFTYRSPHFCFPWKRPCDYHAICCMDGKTIQCLPNPRSMYLSIFKVFWVIRCFKSMCKSKNRYFYHIFVSPGDAPGAITLNVVWMEREFDAYKLSRCMYASIFNSFPVIRTASAKNRRFHIPQPTFLFLLETSLRLSRNMLYGWKDNSMLAKPLAACTYLSSKFPSYTSMRKSKNRYFYHIFVSPGDAPGAITLNVV